MADKFRYEIIVYWSKEDHSFLAEVPKLQGCMADGLTYREAVDNTGLVINGWIDTATLPNRPMPKPKGKLMHA